MDIIIQILLVSIAISIIIDGYKIYKIATYEDNEKDKDNVVVNNERYK